MADRPEYPPSGARRLRALPGCAPREQVFLLSSSIIPRHRLNRIKEIRNADSCIVAIDPVRRGRGRPRHGPGDPRLRTVGQPRPGRRPLQSSRHLRPRAKVRIVCLRDDRRGIATTSTMPHCWRRQRRAWAMGLSTRRTWTRSSRTTSQGYDAKGYRLGDDTALVEVRAFRRRERLSDCCGGSRNRSPSSSGSFDRDLREDVEATLASVIAGSAVVYLSKLAPRIA